MPAFAQYGGDCRRSVRRAMKVVTATVDLGILYIIGVRTIVAAILLCRWNQAPARPVCTFAQGHRIPDVVHS
jgi:hypothetical protein